MHEVKKASLQRLLNEFDLVLARGEPIVSQLTCSKVMLKTELPTTG